MPRASPLLGSLTGLLVAALLVPAPSAAQDDATEGPEPVEQERAAARVLSPAEVAAEAQTVITSLYRLQARIHHVSEIEHHVARIDALGGEVRRLEADSDLDVLDVQPQRELRNLREHWTELDTRLEETGEALEESSSRLEEEIEGVRDEHARWEATKEAAGEYPRAAVQQVDEVLSTITEVKAELEATLERVLAAQTELAAHAIASGDVLTQLERALEESQKRIFTRTHPPGFGGMTGREPTGIVDQLHGSFVHHVHSLDRFATSGSERVYVHALFVALLLAFLYWVRREHQLPTLDGPAGRSLGHPIAMTVLVGLLLVRPLYPLAPRAVIELTQVAAVVPLLLVRTAPKVRTLTGVVVTLYVLEWLRLLLDEHDAEHRLALQLTAFLATAGFAFNAWRAEGIARPAWGAASLAALVGLVSSLAGYVPLGVLLVEGIIASAFVVVVLLALHWALMGAVEAGLTTPFAQRTVLGRHTDTTRKAAQRLAAVVFAFGFFWITLDYFRVREAVLDEALSALNESVQLGEVEISLGDVLAFGLGIWAAVVLSRVLAAVLEEDVAPRMKLGPGVPAAAALVVRYTVLALGFLLAAAAAGIGLSQLALFAGALGVGVGFGLQNVVSNFVAGLLLVFGRPVKVGDTIDIAGFRGTVAKIGIRSSTIHSWTGADVIIPNSKLIDAELVNWTHDDSCVRVDLAVGVAYGSDLRQVHGILLEAAQELEYTLSSPPPAVLMTGFGDSAIDFRVQIWIARPPDMPKALSALGLAVDEALGAANIEIPFPQRDLHIRSDATKEPR